MDQRSSFRGSQRVLTDILQANLDHIFTMLAITVILIPMFLLTVILVFRPSRSPSTHERIQDECGLQSVDELVERQERVKASEKPMPRVISQQVTNEAIEITKNKRKVVID